GHPRLVSELLSPHRSLGRGSRSKAWSGAARESQRACLRRRRQRRNRATPKQRRNRCLPLGYRTPSPRRRRPRLRRRYRNQKESHRSPPRRKARLHRQNYVVWRGASREKRHSLVYPLRILLLCIVLKLFTV